MIFRQFFNAFKSNGQALLGRSAARRSYQMANLETTSMIGRSNLFASNIFLQNLKEMLESDLECESQGQILNLSQLSLLTQGRILSNIKTIVVFVFCCSQIRLSCVL